MVEKKAEAADAILEALKKDGLNPLMMAVYDFFKCPVMLADINSRVIFQYPLQRIGDHAWDTIIEKKVLSSEETDLYIKDSQHSNKYEIWEPYYANQGMTANYPRIYSPIVYYGAKQGVLAVFLGQRPLEDGDLAAIKMFTDALQIKLKKDISGNLDWIPPAARNLRDMLDENANEYLRNNASNVIRESIVGNVAVIASSVFESARTSYFSDYVTAKLIRQYRNVIATTYNNRITILIGEIYGKEFKKGNLNIIGEITEDLYLNGLSCGISEPFSNLESIKSYYSQAELLAQMAAQRGKKTLFAKDEYSNLIYYSIVNAGREGIYIPPIIRRIYLYDKEKNTEYYQTLSCFATNFYDKDTASEIMSIHRNTLTYRLNKIEEVFQIDLSDIKIRRDLYSGFMLMKQFANIDYEFSIIGKYN